LILVFEDLLIIVGIWFELISYYIYNIHKKSINVNTLLQIFTINFSFSF